MFKAYYFLTKPGIVYSNVLTAIAGFFLASKGSISLPLFFALVFGLGFVIACACVFNNYFDREIDSKMERTQKRALVRKIIHTRNALIFGFILGIVGFGLLLLFTNILTAGIAFVGFIFYVFFYTFGKRKTVHGTLIGTISGAVPPAVGYCTVTNNFDLAALLLFLILVFWQMPHFYAIAIFRKEDYTAASIPVLPIKKGITRTKEEMVVYVIAFLFSVCALTVFHFTGYVYLIVMFTLTIMWLVLAFMGHATKDDKVWARKMFFYSLIIITVFSLLLIFSSLMP